MVLLLEVQGKLRVTYLSIHHVVSAVEGNPEGSVLLDPLNAREGLAKMFNEIY